MLKAVVVVRPQRAEVLCQRLLERDLVVDLDAAEARGYGRQKGHLEDYQQAEYRIDFLPKVVITALVRDEQRDAFCDLVVSTCRTGRIGDGKIFLMRVERMDG